MKRMMIVAMTAALAGCAVGPDFHTPAAPSANGYALEGPPAIDGQRLQTVQVVEAQWWRAFGSPQLDAMVDDALKANPDLKSADAALRQARALLAVQRGAFWPQVEADYLGQRAKTSEALAPVPADNQSIYSLHTAQVVVSYTPDVFGGVRRGVEAAKAQTEAQRFQYEAARTSLIANVVAAAIQEASLREELDAADKAAQAGRDILSFIRRQAEIGGLGQADVAAQETVLAQAEQAVPPLRKALAQQRTALAVLLGREPGQAPRAELSLDAVTLPSDLPLVLPAQLVRRRPDVRAAEANLHAASAQVGVAIAARIPNITLSAAGGGSSLNLGSLLTQPNQFWTLSAGITQPIFAGGALLGRQHAAEAGLEQAKAQYRSTVLAALKNTADSLDALAVDADGLRVAAAADAAARRSLGFATRQLTLGQVGALQARTAQQAQAQAAAALAIARAARLADTAALYQALGGGWSDRAD